MSKQKYKLSPREKAIDLGAAFIKGLLAQGVALDVQKDREILGGYKPRREATDGDYTHTMFTLLKDHLVTSGTKGDVSTFARLALGSVVKDVAGENRSLLGRKAIILQKDRILVVK